MMVVDTRGGFQTRTKLGMVFSAVSILKFISSVGVHLAFFDCFVAVIIESWAPRGFQLLETHLNEEVIKMTQLYRYYYDFRIIKNSNLVFLIKNFCFFYRH